MSVQVNVVSHAWQQAAAAREGALSGTTLLAYDERMTLHREDATMPHPERPDRIRAVIARLMSSGLAGALQLHPAPQLFEARTNHVLPQSKG